ncbi:MAG: Ig-like domain-containing protein [Lachnospiraceae bacterium]|nr:Ig-like domain-containing protein [Lachnospiraceae bacterium]
MRISKLTEIKEMVEAKFDGSSPAQLEDYDEKNAYSVNCRRYAEFVKLYVDANEKADDATGAAGIKALTEELAKRYGLGIEITPKKFTMEIGETGNFTVIVDGLFDILSQCKISTFDKEAVSVNAAGEIRALSDGEGNVIVKYGKKEHKIPVRVGEGNLHIDPKGYNQLEKGKTQNLTLKNADGLNVKGTPEWKSSDKKVVKVTADGKVSAVGAGKATATAVYHKREYKKTFTVTQRVELSETKLTLTVGTGKKLTLLGAESGKVDWGIKGSAGVITITQKGKVTAKSPGKVTVIAEYKGKKYSCVVTVKKKEVKKKVDLTGAYIGTMTINFYTFSTTPANTYERKGYIRVDSVGNGKYNISASADSKTGLYTESYGGKSGISGSSGSISFSDEYDSFSCNGKTATWTHYVYAEDASGNAIRLVEWTVTGTKNK